MPPNPNRPGRQQSPPQINHSINNNAPSLIFPIVSQPTNPNVFLPPPPSNPNNRVNTRQQNRQNRLNQRNANRQTPINPIDSSTPIVKGMDDTSTISTPKSNKNIYLIGGAAAVALLIVSMKK